MTSCTTSGEPSEEIVNLVDKSLGRRHTQSNWPDRNDSDDFGNDDDDYGNDDADDDSDSDDDYGNDDTDDDDNDDDDGNDDTDDDNDNNYNEKIMMMRMMIGQSYY